MFCVMTWTLACGAEAIWAIAKWPSLGSYVRSTVLPGSATTWAGIQNLFHQSRGLSRKAPRVPQSSTHLAQTPFSPRKVGMPLGAESPEPVTNTTGSPCGWCVRAPGEQIRLCSLQEAVL